MPNFTAGTSFTDGVTNDVTAAKLNALVADAVPTSSLSLNSTTGTIATFNSTTGTIATLNSTTGTIANFTASTANITLGTIPTLTTGTTTGTAGVFTSGTITTGLIPTLTAGTTTSTAGIFTSGTITTLNSTTPTFLGAITASTNTINVGSGQIYKDASGNFGIGTASPTANLHVVKTTSQTDIDSATQAISITNTASDTSGNLTGIRLKQDNVTNVAQGYIGLSSTGNSATRANLIIATPNTSGNSTERLRIDASGNVGIGASPADTNNFGRSLDIRSSTGAAAYFRDSDDASKYSVTGFFGADSNAYLGSWGASTGAVIYTSGTERLRIDSSGNFGIGTASPSYKLEVTSNTNDALISASGAADNIGLRVSNTQTGGKAYRILAPATGSGYAVGGLVFEDQAAGARMSIDSSGGVTIAGLAGSGSRAVNASAAGLLSAASDASLKEEVVGAHIAGLDEILQIHPKMYRWKDDIANRGENASVELGFIANDVAPIIPSAAPLGNDGLYGFYDRSITAALVKAVQELKLENDSLKARITALEAK